MKQILAMLSAVTFSLFSFTASAQLPPAMSWEVDMSTTDEVERNVRIYAVLNHPSPNGTTVTANLTFTGDAINGTDYDPLATTITILPGQTEGYVRVHIIDDAIFEQRESIFITFDQPVGAIRGFPFTHDLRIKRNDFE